jgi:PAS domain S-box-containing protein
MEHSADLRSAPELSEMGDPTPASHHDPGVDLLIRAGVVLATSLQDQEATMREVAGLTVPGLGDMCVIDLLDEDGTIKDVAVVCVDPELERELERLRARFPLSIDGRHPVATVIRGGRAVLLERMASEDLRSFAESDAHARFMIEHDYRSVVVAPLVARDRTLGAISVLRLGERSSFTREDLDLTQALAWRAALAIDNARLFAELRAVEERLEAVLVNLAEAITVSDAQGRTIFANQAAADLLGVPGPQQLTEAEAGSIMGRFLVLDEQGHELSLQSMPSRRLFAGERPGPLLVRNIVRATGEERWLMVRCSPVYEADGWTVRYAVNVFENVTDIKRAQLAGDFLAETSRALASSLDYGVTLQSVAQLAVPQIADWCAVDMLNAQDEIERVAVHHSDRSKLDIAERLASEYPYHLDEPTGVAAVIRSGEPLLARQIEPQGLAAFARDEHHLQLLREVGMTSAIVVPMLAAGKVSGAITLVTAESGRRLRPQDLELAEELGRRAGVAIENARLYTERTQIARTLQQALLPESLPEIADMQLDALYTAAGELNEVGGDFYDAFDYDRDRWMLVIGDVCGKGPRAAAVTALARYTLRAAAMSDQSPAEMLATLNQALLRGEAGDLCTVCLVTLAAEPCGARLTVTLGGHPPPLLIAPTGEIEQAGQIGTLLGALDPLNVEECDTLLRHEETLLLYTDGVIDAGAGQNPIGEDGLRQLCAGASDLALGELLTRVEEAALERSEGRLRDDLALLAVRPAQVRVGSSCTSVSNGANRSPCRSTRASSSAGPTLS